MSRFLWRLTKGTAFFSVTALVGSFVHDKWFAQKKPILHPIGIPAEAKASFSCTSSWIAKVLNLEEEPKFRTETMVGGCSGPSLTRIIIEEKDIEPQTFVVKYVSLSDLPIRSDMMERVVAAFFNLEELFGREVKFYQEFQKETQGIIGSPKSYLSTMEDYGSRSPLLVALWDLRPSTRALMALEDLGQSQNRVGDQIHGERVHQTIQALGRLHGHFWNTSAELQDSFLYNITFGTSKLSQFFLQMTFKESKKEQLEGMNDKWKDFDPRYGVIFSDPDFISTLDFLLKNFKTKLSPFCHSVPPEGSPLFKNHTLVHGDFHPGNQFFKDGELVMIDWQFFGKMNNTTEFVYFLNSCVNPEPENDLKLMKLYYQSLIQSGVSEKAYPFETFEAEYHIRCLTQFAAYVSMLESETPEIRRKRGERNPNMAEMDNILPIFFKNVTKRAKLTLDKVGPNMDLPLIAHKE